MNGSAMQTGKGVLAGKGETPIFTPSQHKTPSPILMKFCRIDYDLRVCQIWLRSVNPCAPYVGVKYKLNVHCLRVCVYVCITCMHGSAMQSGKGVLAGKGEMPIFTPSPHKNPWPDLNETL